MSARSAADFLTRATAVLATLFVLLSIVLAGLAAVDRSGTTSIDTSLAREAAPAAPITAPGDVPLATGDPLAGIAAKADNDQEPANRSEERGVGQEGVSTCRPRGATYH